VCETHKLPLAQTWVPSIVTCHAMNVIESNDKIGQSLLIQMKIITRAVVPTTIVVGVMCVSRLQMVFIMSMILVFGDSTVLA